MSAHTVSFAGLSAHRSPPGAPGFGARVRAMLRARQTRSILGQMSPHMLADIGLSPADAQTEAARPFWDIASRRSA